MVKKNNIFHKQNRISLIVFLCMYLIDVISSKPSNNYASYIDVTAFFFVKITVQQCIGNNLLYTLKNHRHCSSSF